MNSMRLAIVAVTCALGVGAAAQTAAEKKGKEALSPAAAAQPGPAKSIPPAPADAVPAPAAPAGEAQAQGRPASKSGLPDGYKLNLMLRATVIAVNQANKTGNYSVLRDLGAPGFQAANNPAQLAEIFADLRKRDLDLSPVLFYQPKFASRPTLSANGMLRVTGFFPSRPQQVHFDLVFEQIGDDWRLHGLSIGAAPASTPDAQAGARDGAGKPVAAESGAAGLAPRMASANMDAPAQNSDGGAPAAKSNAAPKPQGRLPASEPGQGKTETTR
jgi:hypothetical protein